MFICWLDAVPPLTNDDEIAFYHLMLLDKSNLCLHFCTFTIRHGCRSVGVER